MYFAAWQFLREALTLGPKKQYVRMKGIDTLPISYAVA